MSTLKLQQLLLQVCLLAVWFNTALACHGTLLASGIKGDEKEIILKEHNRLRQTVATGRYAGQPGAENMREIVWDNELAQRAQEWAENCQFRHDPHRTINRFTMGQNLAIIWSTAPLEADDGDFPSRIQSWFNEVQKYKFGQPWSKNTGHYSQLVWGETSLVGCGFAEYKDTSKYNKLYVCNYGPGGNVVGSKPYKAGKPSCGSYGMKPSSRYQGLCAAPDGSNKKAINVQKRQYTSSGYGGNSFGTNEYGGAQALTTETTQHHHQYRNDLEAYKPTPDEFKKSVYKHTVLRTYVDPQQQQELLQPNAYNTQEQQQLAKRGWSFLTWRG